MTADDVLYRSKVCRFYAEGKECRYGKLCKFSHSEGGLGKPRHQIDKNDRSSNKGRHEKPKREFTALENTRRQWSYNLTGYDALSPDTLKDTIQSALDMIDSGESGVKQDVIKDLGNEKGLSWLQRIVESDFIDAQSHYQLNFIDHCVPFLQLLSHDDVLNSLVLEKAVGTIFNVIYGPSGRRGIQFMEKVAGHVQVLSVAGGSEEEKLGKALAASTRALLALLELNHEGMVKSEFKGITTTLTTCIAGCESSEYNIRRSTNNLRRIKEHLQMGDALPLVGNYAPQIITHDFQVNIDLPGGYSAKGPRHGNDHEKIEDIEILPTTEEMKATRSEFLPLKDRRTKHHEDGVHRLLDSQFRLLREDTAGQLREAVCALVAKWAVLVVGKNTAKRKQSLRQMNAKLKIFDNVHIERMRFERRNGMLIDLSFTQPERLSKPNIGEGQRRAHWKDSRDLQRGSLVALVDTDLETTFLLVADRQDSPRHAPEGETENTAGIRDLVSNRNRAMISLSLVNPTSILDQARIVKLAQEFKPQGAVLVEFPGLLFASFQPILKCLQDLHRNPTLPFGQWLVPDPEVQYDSLDGVVKVPAPLYLSKRGVQVDISCITKDGHRLLHSNAAPVSIEDLEKHTTLDYGQCQGLLLSLQSELALIQGPPGTGKSYVGLQISKILLQNAKKLKIGPIICVYVSWLHCFCFSDDAQVLH